MSIPYWERKLAEIADEKRGAKMSRAKKKFKAKFKPGTLVKYKDGSGVSGEVSHTIDGGEYGNRVFYKAGGWDREQMLMPVEPKKPKPARVWRCG